MKVSAKPYGCNICNESFHLAKSLQEHVKIHMKNPAGSLTKNLVIEKEIVAKKSAPEPIKGKHFLLSFIK